jgi:CHAT domain-containing protein
MALNLYLNQIDAFFPAMSEKEKAKFYQLIAPKFEQFNSYVLIRYNENPTLLGKMYDYQLATKALLLNSTNKVKERILSSNDFILIEKFKKWNTQKELLAKAANMTNDERKQLNVNLTELAEITNELEKELNASSELFKNANDTRRVRWSDVQKQLKNDEAAIELIRFVKFRFDQGGVYTQDSIFYAGLIVTNTNKNNPDIVILKNGTELEKQYLKYYRNSIKSKSEDEFSYNQYWLRIKKGLNNNIKKIYLSPDGVYNLINLNTLKNIQTKTYLLDELDIRIVTNTKTLLATQTSNKNIENKIVLIGSPDFAFNAKNIASKYKGVSSEQAAFIERAASGMLSPLPGTRIEVEKIAGMLTVNNWQTQIFTEVNASEESIKKVVNPRILHIATHGFFEEDVSRDKNKKKETLSEDENPLLKSGIMLAGASLTLIKRKNESANLDLNVASGTEDGILTAYEAMNLSLDKTDLVVLSACETGLGEVKNGEGVYGLQRAFNVAGAKTLIFSLWTVNDAATQQLMTTFYSEMLKPGNTKRQSFKNAQLELRKTFPEPYYWGAFVMVGD